MATRNPVLSDTDLFGACDCVACRALLDECGASNFRFYRARLLQRGWAGTVTPAERGYQRAHSAWMQAAVTRGTERAATQGWLGGHPDALVPSQSGK